MQTKQEHETDVTIKALGWDAYSHIFADLVHLHQINAHRFDAPHPADRH